MALCAASFAWNLAGGGFPWTLHPEEALSIRALGSSAWEGTEPALLLQLGRLVRAGLAPDTPSEIATSARFIASIFGSLSVLLLWRILRDTLTASGALFGAGLIAVSPLAILSAHYFTTDSLLLFLVLSALFCLARTLEGGDRGWSMLLGISMGLALATHYFALSLVLLCALGPTITRIRDRARYWTLLGWSAGLAAITFFIVNPGILLQPGMALSQISNQAQRLLTGDHLYVTGPTHWFSFHLIESLAPAVTTPVLWTAILGLAIAARQWSQLAVSARLTLIYGLLIYALAELSPLKPHPDTLRYILATLPALGLAAGLVVDVMARGIRQPSLRWLPIAAMLALLAFPAVQSLRTVAGLNDDTRQRADRWVDANSRRILRELHSSARPNDVLSLTQVDLAAARRAGVTHVAASSFVYDTFARGSRLANQKPYVYERHERYQELFEYPYEEFTPVYPSLGWNNPTIRIIDVRKPPPPGRP